MPTSATATLERDEAISPVRDLLNQLRDVREVPAAWLDELAELRDELTRLVRRGRNQARKQQANPPSSTSPAPRLAPIVVPTRNAPAPDRASGPRVVPTQARPPRTTVPIAPKPAAPQPAAPAVTRTAGQATSTPLPRWVLLLAVLLAIAVGTALVVAGQPAGLLIGIAGAAGGVSLVRRRMRRPARGTP